MMTQFKLNEQQQGMLSVVNEIVTTENTGFYLISGVAGSGKTTVLNEIIKNYENHEIQFQKKMKFAAYSHSACGTLRKKIGKDKDVSTLARMFTLVHQPFKEYASKIGTKNLNSNESKIRERFNSYHEYIMDRYYHLFDDDITEDIKSIIAVADDADSCELGDLYNYFDAFGGTPIFKKLTPDEVKNNEWLKGNIIIIDEASMVDDGNYSLLKALSEVSLVICFGDKGQLPPVTPYGQPKFFLYTKLPDLLYELTQSERVGSERVSKFHKLRNYTNNNILRTFGYSDKYKMLQNAYNDGETFAFICYSHKNRVLTSLDYMLGHPTREKIEEYTLNEIDYITRGKQRQTLDILTMPIDKVYQYLIPVEGDVVFSEKETYVYIEGINPITGETEKRQETKWYKDDTLRLSNISYRELHRCLITAEVEVWDTINDCWIKILHEPYNDRFSLSIFPMFIGDNKLQNSFHNTRMNSNEPLATPITHVCSMTGYRSQGREFDNVAVILDGFGDTQVAYNYTAGTRAIKRLRFGRNIK